MEVLRRHPLAWKPEDFSVDNPNSTPEYLHVVDEDGMAEVDAALEKFKGKRLSLKLGLDGDAIGKNNFLLPTLRTKLEQACQDVHSGKGVAVVRGIPTAGYTPEDSLSVFLGVADYIGDIRGVQDRKGSMVAHITDAGWTVPPQLRHGIHTNSNLEWHSDWGVDILALHVRGLAARGGDTFVASSWTICSELLVAHPKALEVLQSPTWPVQVSGSPPRHILMPLVKVIGDKLFFAVDPGRLGLHPASARVADSLVPDLSSEQHEALGLLSEFASKHQLRLDLRPGDMVFINNWAVLHARDAYVDEGGARRHLVRLWLRNSSLGWPVPDSMKAPWEAAFGPLGDGNPVFVKGGRTSHITEQNYPVVPTREYAKPKYTAGSASFILEDSEDVNAGGPQVQI
ncbi:hypothetical protein B0T14DRAFT_431180 [Immersiella caudata]|uniref:TauD/TfdA-like domain-containing protein n=1 Tax=Immersiella caudata TaxID=314043 RepID=A0AA39WPU0_9PEZI|nr:hypothetical protein B0T14DRAFT_431180 [Immersiella caudata]